VWPVCRATNFDSRKEKRSFKKGAKGAGDKLQEREEAGYTAEGLYYCDKNNMNRGGTEKTTLLKLEERKGRK